MDSVLEEKALDFIESVEGVSILVSVDSVLEDFHRFNSTLVQFCFNPSFCGFGIGGSGDQCTSFFLHEFQS